MKDKLIILKTLAAVIFVIVLFFINSSFSFEEKLAEAKFDHAKINGENYSANKLIKREAIIIVEKRKKPVIQVKKLDPDTEKRVNQMVKDLSY